MGEVVIDSGMIRLLSAIDGEMTINHMAASLDVPASSLRSALAKLIKAGLVVQADGPKLFHPNQTLLDPTIVYRKSLTEAMGEVSLNAAMLRLLTIIDDHKTIARIAAELGTPLSGLRPALGALLDMGLIEPSTNGGPVLDSRFLGEMRRNFLCAVGPIGELIVEEVLSHMGLDLQRIPVRRAPELIDHLAREIPDENHRLEFQRALIPMMPTP